MASHMLRMVTTIVVANGAEIEDCSRKGAVIVMASGFVQAVKNPDGLPLRRRTLLDKKRATIALGGLWLALVVALDSSCWFLPPDSSCILTGKAVNDGGGSPSECTVELYTRTNHRVGTASKAPSTFKVEFAVTGVKASYYAKVSCGGCYKSDFFEVNGRKPEHVDLGTFLLGHCDDPKAVSQ